MTKCGLEGKKRSDRESDSRGKRKKRQKAPSPGDRDQTDGTAHRGSPVQKGKVAGGTLSNRKIKKGKDLKGRGARTDQAPQARAIN